MATYLDEAGLTRLWNKISSKFLKLTGGTLTGNLKINKAGNSECILADDTTMDISAANNGYGSGTRWASFVIKDKNNQYPGYFGSDIGSNGLIQTRMRARNLKSDGTVVDNHLVLGVNKSGGRTVTISEAAPWRNALGASSGTWPISVGGTGLTASPSMLTNLGSTSAANVLQASPRPGITGTLSIAHGGTGMTGVSAYLDRSDLPALTLASGFSIVSGTLGICNWGPVYSFYCAFKRNAASASGTTFTIGTFSLYKPLVESPLDGGTGAATAWITPAGQLRYNPGSGVSIAANTAFYVKGMWISEDS